MEFALEAKRYGLANSIGVRETARLIARLRFRQFGIFVTTSCLADQAYQELREDDHPLVVVCAADIVEILRGNGITTAAATRDWLKAKFPAVGPAQEDDVPF